MFQSKTPAIQRTHAAAALRKRKSRRAEADSELFIEGIKFQFACKRHSNQHERQYICVFLKKTFQFNYDHILIFILRKGQKTCKFLSTQYVSFL